jgi:uncharacterized protein
VLTLGFRESPGVGRVGITPHPSRRCTQAAKRPEILQWADIRASFGVVPKFVREEWGIDLGCHHLTVE